MHEPLAALAALPAQTRVAGCALRDYSLGHELFLIREQSPFIFGTVEDIDEGHIYEAILICTSTFNGLKFARSSYLYTPILSLLRRRVAKHLKIECKEAAIQKFSDYRKNGCLELPFSDTIKPGKETARDPGAPFILRLQQFLMLKFRLSEAEAWDYPVGLAKMRWQTYWEQEGGSEVKNWFDQHIDDVKARLNEEEAA
jgi:hypothetical protein